LCNILTKLNAARPWRAFWYVKHTRKQGAKHAYLKGQEFSLFDFLPVFLQKTNVLN